MRKFLKAYFPIILLFFAITCLFFYKFLQGYLPIPLDTLTGMYFPWLDYKWGYLVGVPVKNPALTDIVSQLYPWRNLAINIWKSGQIPLWNVYSFSGTPLLANWQSAVFYPLNLIMFIFGKGYGWSIIIMLQPLLSMIFTYLFLRELKLSSRASILGAIIYSFSGFMMIFLEYNLTGQGAIWLPLILFILEKYIQKRKLVWLPLLSGALFFLLTAGSFQVSFYSLLISSIYLCARSMSLYGRNSKTFKLIAFGGLFYVLGLGLSALQLIPTLELFLYSFRGLDQNIAEYNYGLLPIKSIITFFSPDFFGNPVTGNFRGFIYHETAGYFGILAIPLIVASIFKRKNFLITFFGITFIISFLLVFDTFLGRLVYQLNVPMFSSSYASRALLLTDFSAAVLAAFGLEYLWKNRKIVFRSGIIVFAVLATVFTAISFSILLMRQEPLMLESRNLANLIVSLRNMVLPLGLLMLFLVALKIFSSNKLITVIIILLIGFDLFRFGLKYNPFVPARLLYPDTPVSEFLQEKSGYFRIEREKINIFPPNTWIPYQLMSASGYDPLYPKQYYDFYSVYNDDIPGISYTRYAELENYNSPILDLAGVKYLIVAKRNKDGKIDKISNEISNKISDEKYKRVFEDTVTVVLENPTVMPRATLYGNYDIRENHLDALRLLSDNYDFRNSIIINKKPAYEPSIKNPKDKIEIISYLPNEVILKTLSSGNTIAMLTDSFYPGWQVEVDGQKAELLLADGIYRAVAVPNGSHTITFSYQPKSFKNGLLISLGSLLIIVLSFFFFRSRQKTLKN